MDLGLARRILELILNDMIMAIQCSIAVCFQLVETKRLASIASTRSLGLYCQISYGRSLIVFDPTHPYLSQIVRKQLIQSQKCVSKIT